MQNKPNLIGFGAVAVDDLVFLETFPHPDSKMQVTRRERMPGGLAGTALVAAARLGAHPSYFGVLDNDELSSYTIAEFQKQNVQTSLCIKQPGAGPLYSTIMVDQSSGKRTILFSVDKFRLPQLHQITKEKFTGCEMIFIDSFSLEILPHVRSLADALSLPIIADIEDAGIMAYKDCFNKLEYLIFSVELAQSITEENDPVKILHQLETPHRQVSVITAGAKGCWFKENCEAVYHMPAFDVDVVDTTGCGDVFHGGFAAAIINKASIPEAVIQASAAAAMKTGKPGGQAGIPNKTELTQFLRDRPDNRPMVVN